jgi:hypothetical protein
LLQGSVWGNQVWINQQPAGGSSAYFLNISPGWLQTMRVPLISGRDFRDTDIHPRVAIVNETFARHYFDGENPVGKSFQQMVRKQLVPIEIVGYVRDARYRNLREPMRPTAYVPMASTDPKGGLRAQDQLTFLVRTSRDTLALASVIREEVSRARPGLRVSRMVPQMDIVRQHTIRERLLAALASFFAVVAVVLAAVGLYGVLNYSVVQRRREIGIRMALGAPSGDVARRVLADVVAMVLIGVFAGLAAGIGARQSVEMLLYAVKPTDAAMLALPVVLILVTAVLAAVPAVRHAVRIEPAVTLRAE